MKRPTLKEHMDLWVLGYHRGLTMAIEVLDTYLKVQCNQEFEGPIEECIDLLIRMTAAAQTIEEKVAPRQTEESEPWSPDRPILQRSSPAHYQADRAPNGHLRSDLGEVHRCSVCREVGHNIKTCKRINRGES